jgi:WD40 repeat protein
LSDIFISYAREDRASAKRLAEALTAARGWSVWWDLRLRTGERFPREIERAISDARCVVVLWSPHSIDSDWVTAEVSEGWKRGVLSPVLIGACEPPMPFRQTHSTDLSGWAGSDRAPTFLALLEDVQRVMARGAAVDPIELEQREARMRRVRRFRAARRIGIGAGILAGISGAALLGWFALHKAEEKSFGEDLTAKAENIADGLPRNYNYKIGDPNDWWYTLFEDPGILTLLERSALLAVEGARRANTAHATRTLQRIWPLLPWSDRDKTIDAEVGVLEFNRDGHLLAAGGGCGQTLIWDLRSDEIVGRIDHGDRRETSCKNREYMDYLILRQDALAFSPSSDILATAGPDATARLWTPDGRELKRLQHEHPVTAVRFGPRGDVLVTTDEGGGVRLWDVGTGRELRRMQHDDRAYRPVLSPSGKYLGTASRDMSTRIWDVASGKELHRVMHTEFVGGSNLGVQFCPDESCFVTFGGQGVMLSNIATGVVMWSLPAAKSVIFADDGRVIAIGGGGDYTISWWDVAKREERFNSYETYSDIITTIVGSENGTVLASAGGDGTARAWDIRTGRELKRLPYRREATVALSRDGQLLASSGVDAWTNKRLIEVTRLWPEDLIQSTCAHLSRNFTAAEWEEYFYGAPYQRTCPGIEGEQKRK